MLKGIVEGFEINIENFVQHNYEHPGDGDVICPGSFGMKEIDISECISECNINNCRKCWENAINDFKNLNNLR
jgi:hypothetical protein